MIADSSAGRHRDEAKALFGRAVAHCEKGDWNEALVLVDQAIQLDRQRSYFDRRAVILEHLGRPEDAVAARTEAASIAGQVVLSQLEQVLEFRSDGDRELERLRNGSFAAHQIETSERREKVVDHAMITRESSSFEVRPRIPDLLARKPDSATGARRNQSAKPKGHPGDARPRHQDTRAGERRWNIKQALRTLLRRLQFWRT